MKKKVLAIFAALCFATCLLAGCSSQSDETTTSETTKASEKSADNSIAETLWNELGIGISLEEAYAKDIYPCEKVTDFSNLNLDYFCWDNINFNESDSYTANGFSDNCNITFKISVCFAQNSDEASLAPSISATMAKYVEQIFNMFDMDKEYDEKSLILKFQADAYDENDNNIDLGIEVYPMTGMGYNGKERNGKFIADALPNWASEVEIVDLTDGSDEAGLINACLSNLVKQIGENEELSSFLLDKYLVG